MTGNPYPHLAPALRQLPEDTLRLWGDPPARREALAAVVDAWEAGSPALEGAVARVDGAVSEGLRALGLPRGPIRGVRIDSVRPGLSGQKLNDCTLVLVGDRMRTLVRTRDQVDAAFRTWIHESLHARQPYAAGASAEYRDFRGYEEGLVEGLTQVVLAAAGITVDEVPFASYVSAYRALASVIGVEAEALWRALWSFPTGAVRAGFPSAVGALYEAASGRSLPAGGRERLRAVGDTLFRTERAAHRPDPSVQATVWRTALT